MIIFGGYFRNDAWSLSFDPSPAWAPLPSGPSFRTLHAAVYDPVRRRMIVSGGYMRRYSDMDTSTAQVWALSLSGDPVWSELPRHPSMDGIYNHSMIYDAVRDRLLTVGGSIKRAGTVIVRSLDHRIFSLPLGSSAGWSELPSTGTVALRALSTVYDPGRDRLVMLGGYTTPYPYEFSNGIWARPADDAGVWAPLAPDGAPPSLEWRRGLFDFVHDRVVVVLTTTDPEADDADQAWSLAFSGVTAVPLSRGDAFSLDRPWPVPAREGAQVSFTLPDAAPARLDLLDVAGRRIWSLEVGARGAGKHVVSLLGAGELSPGLYLVRLARGTRSVSAKLIVTR